MQTRKLEDTSNIVHVSLRLDKNLHKQLKLFAFEHDKSLSLVMEEAITYKVTEEKKGINNDNEST